MKFYFMSLLCLFCVRVELIYPPPKRFGWAWPHVIPDPALEDDYIQHFGNDTGPNDLFEGLQEWEKIRGWNSESGMEEIKKFCAKAHKLAGKGGNITINGLLLRPRTLIFKNVNYKPRRIDVLSYGVEGVTDVEGYPTMWYLFEGAYGYLAKGKAPDCVYYLTLLSSNQKKYSLFKHVCGIDM